MRTDFRILSASSVGWFGALLKVQVTTMGEACRTPCGWWRRRRTHKGEEEKHRKKRNKKNWCAPFLMVRAAVSLLLSLSPLGRCLRIIAFSGDFDLFNLRHR